MNLKKKKTILMENSIMNRIVKILLPVAVVLVSTVIAMVIIKSKPEVDVSPVRVTPQLVRVIEVEKKPVRINVYTQGNVVPRTETSLVAEVSGKVDSISPAFVSGGFFNKGDVLVKIDEKDYRLMVTQARLQVAQAELSLKIEEQESEIAIKEWKRLNNTSPPSLVAREPQLKEARAALESAKASLQQAEINLERTNIRAPYTGRVRSKSVDIGQFVSPGMTLANIYAVDFAEIRLPLPDEELAFLDIPEDFRSLQTYSSGPKITLKAEFAGKMNEWTGYLTRIEGEVDSRSRMVYVVARVEDPYSMKSDNSYRPLIVGMFVHAEIEGRLLDDVVVVPRTAIRDNNNVLIVDSEKKMWFREVTILKLDPEQAFIRTGLNNGDLICISALNAVVDGMPVTVYDDSEDNGDTGEGGVR